MEAKAVEKSMSERIRERIQQRDSRKTNSKFMEYYEAARLPEKARDWSNGVGALATKMQSGYSEGLERFQTAEEYRQYTDGLLGDVDNLLNSYSYAKNYAGQIQDAAKRSEYLKGIEQTKDQLTALSTQLRDEEQRNAADEYFTDLERKKEFESKSGWDKFWGALGDNLTMGASNISKGIYEAVDWILPDEMIMGGENIITKSLDDWKAEIDKGNEEIRKRNAAMSEGWQLFGQFAQGLGSALPTAAMALMSGGTSLPGQMALGAPATTTQIVTSGLSNLAKDPNFWMSAIPTFGNTYASALEDGATEGEATVTAVLNGFAGSLIEVGGGIQKIPQGQKSIRAWLKSAMEEGGEEVVQSAVENFLKQQIYNQEIPVYSATDQQAIINPTRAMGEFALGSAVGGLLGGVNMGIDAAVNGYGRSRSAPGGEFLQFIPGNGRMGIEGSDGYGGRQTVGGTQGGHSEVYRIPDWGTGRADQANDGRTASEMGRVYAEDAESFQRRVSEDVLRRSGRIDQHGAGQIAYLPAQQVAADSEAGKAELGLRKLGASVVVTEGSFETNRNGLTTLHTDAATAPGGAIYISNQTQIPAELIVAHEGLHFLQRQNSPLYKNFYEDIYRNADLLSDAYKRIGKKINEEHYGGRLDLDDPDSVIPIFTELTAYIHEWLTVDPEHAKNTFGGMFRDWDAVVEASRALREAMDRGVQTEGSGEYDGEKNFLGGYFRRGKGGTAQESGVYGEVSENDRRSERKTIETERGRAEFEAIRERSLSKKQRKENRIAEKYGYPLYHIPEGSAVEYNGKSEIMSHTAMVKPGLDAVFALDGTEQDYVHHELFHKFMEHKQHGEGQLLEKAQRAIDYDSDRWSWYHDSCEKDYADNFTLDIVYEEITGDLCEYAMSGSETMRNRLEGLFEPGALDALCKEARKVFAANRTGKRVGEGSSQSQPSSDRNPRYYLEESAETNAENVNNIHTSELLASLREAGAYEGLSAYLLRQAIPQAEGSSLAALVRDKQAQTPGLSRTQAVQDLAAEYVNSRLFTDADAIRQLAEARPETARQILSWLRSAESPDEALIQAEKLYSQALGEGEEQTAAAELSADGIQTSMAQNEDGIYKEVNVHGKINTELDEVDLINRIIYEDKNASKLYMDNPDFPQTEQQWAEKQIFNRGKNRIEALQQKDLVRLSSQASNGLPSVEELRNIKNYIFRIDVDNPKLRNAVQSQLDRLADLYPDFRFSAIYGGE